MCIRDREKAVRIIKSLISQKYITKAQDSEAESRIDYLADILGVGLVDREIARGGEQSVPPRLAFIELITEFSLPGEEVGDKRCV